MVISHPLDFERAAATATGERVREAVGRYRDDTERRGGVVEAYMTKTRCSQRFEGVFRLSSSIARSELAALGVVFDLG